ncbi:hypothetical protein CANARDRAFT_6822 [[Candida] arabinofermentans NRRL YB-2248]|uniref:Uncharacterized protein n=1 Tax=[Candida] arabinofermentans NRRL YB-2248 TaxID=983967 RepID=A0A1E4T3K4_9ASCO|nr:hypothetical protein CANARDRAFT_6822 [[Candida] arabinofermentans NRRL YB-2248]
MSNNDNHASTLVESANMPYETPKLSKSNKPLKVPKPNCSNSLTVSNSHSSSRTNTIPDADLQTPHSSSNLQYQGQNGNSFVPKLLNNNTGNLSTTTNIGDDSAFIPSGSSFGSHLKSPVFLSRDSSYTSIINDLKTNGDIKRLKFPIDNDNENKQNYSLSMSVADSIGSGLINNNLNSLNIFFDNGSAESVANSASTSSLKANKGD